MYDDSPPKATIGDWLEFESWPEEAQRLVERLAGRRLNYRVRHFTNISELGNGHTDLSNRSR